MSFLQKRTNKLNAHFFKKFQEQVSKAPGFKPVLSYEDFLKMVQTHQSTAKPTDTETETTDAQVS